VALSGLTATSMNEFAEVILGGSIVITAAYVFFGPACGGISRG
jgi:NSS family neurotransmitter:Na+ symporter